MGNLNDLLYLLIYARGKSMRDNENISTKTHLQKEIFLLQKRYPFNELTPKYEFIPLYYGPFSKAVAIGLNTGISMELISNDDNIILTPQGFKYASKIWNSLGDDYKKTIIQTKEEFNRMTVEQLIDYVYEHYPKFAKKSALLKGNVDNYFNQFWKEEQLSDSYFVEIVRKNREHIA
jgi:isocitrate dehydrogenase